MFFFHILINFGFIVVCGSPNIGPVHAGAETEAESSNFRIMYARAVAWMFACQSHASWTLASQPLASRAPASSASCLLDSCLPRVAGLQVAGRWVVAVAGSWVVGRKFPGRGFLDRELRK